MSNQAQLSVILSNVGLAVAFFSWIAYLIFIFVA